MKGVNNPLYDGWVKLYPKMRLPTVMDDKSHFEWLEAWRARGPAVHRFAWAIPNDEAIRVLVGMSPIVEIGAGTGYWAWVIEQAGGKVVCYDQHTDPRDNHYHGNPVGGPIRDVLTYHEILEGGPEKVAQHPDHTLLLCWPPYNDPFGVFCIGYEPKRVVYVGEGYGGCTGSDAFHELLTEEYELEQMVDLPQWEGIHDDMYVYRRK